MFQQQPEPVIVRIVEQPVKKTTVADVIIGSLGIVGVLLLAALVLGLLLGGLLIAVKRMRRRDGLDPEDDASTLRVTPS